MLTHPGRLLRLEELSLLAVAVTVYAHLQFSWLLFAVLFLVPDIFMLGYVVNPRLGAAMYNLGHSVFMALALLAVGYFSAHSVAVAIALIWFSHIAFDRALGYGFKYPTFFKDTHTAAPGLTGLEMPFAPRLRGRTPRCDRLNG